MMPINRCPDCRTALQINLTGCACGWSAKQKSESNIMDYRCQYKTLGEQCERDGTICRSTRSSNKWFCLEHWYEAERVASK